MLDPFLICLLLRKQSSVQKNEQENSALVLFTHFSPHYFHFWVLTTQGPTTMKIMSYDRLMLDIKGCWKTQKVQDDGHTHVNLLEK